MKDNENDTPKQADNQVDHIKRDIMQVVDFPKSHSIYCEEYKINIIYKQYLNIGYRMQVIYFSKAYKM